MFCYNDKLTFGKYKGKRIEHALGEDPTYIRWCLDNIEWFSLSPDLLEALAEIEEENTNEEERQAWNDAGGHY